MEHGRPTVGIDQYDHYGKAWCKHQWIGVTAWKPLPEAYEGEKGGGR
jgi:hypothetical protein